MVSTIVCNHALTEEKYETIKNAFYDNMDRTVHKFPKHDTIIIMEFFNTKVGQEQVLHSVKKLDNWNDNGDRL